MAELTDNTCRTTVPEDGKAIRKLTDGATGSGDGVLQLWVLRPRVKRGRPRKDALRGASAFTRRWVLDYRTAGQRKRMTLGSYPLVSLAKARELANAARLQLRTGTDPASERRAKRVAAANAHLRSFDAIADAWLNKQRALDGGPDAPKSERALSPDTLDKLTWFLSLVRTSLGKLAVDEITRSQVRAALERIGARGRRDTMKRCRATVSRVFVYAMDKELCETDPAASIKADSLETKGAKAKRSHAAIFEPVAFGRLLRDIHGYHGSPEVRIALKLLALTALRPGELRRLRWAWIGGLHAGSSSEPVVTVPAGVMKMRRPHEVPLSRQAVELLLELQRMTGGGEFCFPCQQPRRKVGKDGHPVKRPASRTISESTMNSALRRLGYPNDVHVGHGFRSSFSTLANGAKLFDPDIIEAALAHDTPGVRGVYNRATYDADRRRLTQWWADRCDELREGRAVEQQPATGNVIALVREAVVL